MATLPIALQLYTVRDPFAADPDATLGAIAGMGYEGVELAGFDKVSPGEMKDLLAKHGLRPVAAHSMWVDDLEGAVDAARLLGYKHIVHPWLAPDERTADGYAKVPAAYENARAKAGNDVTLAYHNHDFEFDKTEDGKTGFEIIFDGNDLPCELDTCWAAIGGKDVPPLMKSLAGRLPLLHIKDCSDLAAKTLCEVGTGIVPVADIVAAAPGCGVECLIVEQDDNWTAGDPLKSAKMSLDNLRKIVG